MWWWWWIWIAFIFFVLFLPLSYGWGRGRCGPPYPGSYYRRRNTMGGRTPIAPEPSDVDPTDPSVPPMRGRTMVATRPPETQPNPYSGWSLLADLFWLAVLGAIAWGIYLGVT